MADARSLAPGRKGRTVGKVASSYRPQHRKGGESARAEIPGLTRGHGRSAYIPPRGQAGSTLAPRMRGGPGLRRARDINMRYARPPGPFLRCSIATLSPPLKKITSTKKDKTCKYTHEQSINKENNSGHIISLNQHASTWGIARHLRPCDIPPLIGGSRLLRTTGGHPPPPRGDRPASS